jgi:hypothetical protein
MSRWLMINFSTSYAGRHLLPRPVRVPVRERVWPVLLLVVVSGEGLLRYA